MRTQMVFFQLTEKILFISGGRNMSPKFTNDWGLQQINSVLSSLMVYSLHPRLQKATEPHLQRVFMADACHLNFGKYTLFSCYGVTSNSNASPVAFAINFGNKSTSTWRQLEIIMDDDGREGPLKWIHRDNICFRKLLPLSYLFINS